MTCFQQQQEALQSFLPKSTPELSPKTSSVPGDALINLLDHYNKAKYEDIICRPLKPPYDGMPDQLVPFLNRLGLRHQDESWSSITYIKQGEITHDLIRHFAKINEDTVTDLARHRWSATTVNTDKLTFGHETYNARCLGRLILSSQTDELALLIIARLDPSLRSDGPMILWSICHHIHRNNVAFVESTKQKIRQATLSQFGDDITKYITYARDALHLITAAEDDTTTHKDLLTHIFATLSTSPVQHFKHAVQKWHVAYLENDPTMKALSPLTLLQMADKKVRILLNAGLWSQSETTSIIALKAQIDRQ